LLTLYNGISKYNTDEVDRLFAVCFQPSDGHVLSHNTYDREWHQTCVRVRWKTAGHEVGRGV